MAASGGENRELAFRKVATQMMIRYCDVFLILYVKIMKTIIRTIIAGTITINII